MRGKLAAARAMLNRGNGAVGQRAPDLAFLAAVDAALRQFVDAGQSKRLHLDLRFVSGIPAAYRYGAAELMSVSGVNLGNFAFRHGLPFIFSEFADYRSITYSALLDLAAPGAVDSLLVSCANWLPPATQTGGGGSRWGSTVTPSSRW